MMNSNNPIDRPLRISVNGKRKLLPGKTALFSLIEDIAANPKQVAAEVNLELVPREQHASFQLKDGDKVEIVTLVGGG